MMALVSVVPVLLSGLISFYSITLSHRAEIASIEDALVDQKNSEIQAFITNVVSDLAVILDTEHEGIPLENQKSILGQILKDKPVLEEAAFVSPDGQETARLNRLYPDGVSFSELRDQSHLEQFSVAKKGGIYIGPVYFTVKGPMVTIVAPIENKKRVVINLVSAELRLNQLQRIMLGGRPGKTGYVYLTDRDGFLIGGGASPGGSYPNFKRIGIVSDVLQGKNFLGPEGQRRYENLLGQTVVAAAKFLPDYHWALVAEWPTADADASVNDLLYRNLIATAVVLVAVVLVSILLATLIVRPIQMLERGTERVSQGKFEEGVDIATGDELEDLGAAFNKMMQGLKQLEQLKDEFVFIAAHELRTPVAAMKGYLSLILDGLAGPVTEKTKEFIQKVINSNNRLIQLVNDLLEVARSEAGRLTIKVSAIDIVQPIKDVLSELQSLADKSSVKLVYEPVLAETSAGKPAANIPKAMADADRLKEVIVNLVGNSIKYMGGAGTVAITHEVQDKNLITHVRDTGLGMSKEAQAKLFEKFYRVQTEKTKDITGTGLGLFIVKEIIEKMNGKILVESEEGKGSTFSFSLPLA